MSQSNRFWPDIAQHICISTVLVTMCWGLAATNASEPEKRAGVSAQRDNATTPEQLVYEPMAIGNMWRYRCTTSDGESHSFSRCITSETLINEAVSYHYAVIMSPFDPDHEGYDQLLRHDGIAVVYLEEQPALSIKRTPFVGQKWSNASKDFEETYVVSVIDRPTTTPAGDFKCLVIKNTMVSDGKTNWAEFSYAPGVGLVKTAYDDGSIEVLTRYRVK